MVGFTPAMLLVLLDYEKAFHCFAPGAFSGRPASLYKIGDMYLNGYYVKKNVRDAFRIYRRCLDLLDDDAICRKQSRDR